MQYASDCFQVRFGLIDSTAWIGSEYGLVILSDESASESHTQNTTRTAPYNRGRREGDGQEKHRICEGPKVPQGSTLSVLWSLQLRAVRLRQVAARLLRF